MTDVYGPFDGANWTQSNWYRDAPFWTPSGVFGSPASSTSTGDLPLTTSGLNITIGVGRAHVRGASFERSGTPASQAVTTNGNASLSRRDRVVLRRDLAAKTVAPVVLAGTASASPTPPAITQVENGQWDIPLFSFLVPPNNGTTLTSFIDERGWITPASPGEPAFLTAAARDANLPNPTDGTRCLVGALHEVYRAGAWRGTAPLAYNTTTTDTTSYTSSHTVMTLAIPDPGWPYQLLCSGSVGLDQLGVGVTVAAYIQVNGTTIPPVGADVTNSGGATIATVASNPGNAISGTLTGASTVTLLMFKTGTAGNGFQAAASSLFTSLSAIAMPT